MILAKLNITQQQALDLLAHMEVIEELLITGITEKEAEPHVMTTAQREAIARMLTESPDLSAEDQHLLAIIARNSGRIDGIVESVLQLSRGQPPELQTLDLPTWLEELHAELSETRRLPAARFPLDLAAEIPPVRVNAGHLHQIIANLCDNALKICRQGGPVPPPRPQRWPRPGDVTPQCLHRGQRRR